MDCFLLLTVYQTLLRHCLMAVISLSRVSLLLTTLAPQGANALFNMDPDGDKALLNLVCLVLVIGLCVLLLMPCLDQGQQYLYYNDPPPLCVEEPSDRVIKVQIVAGDLMDHHKRADK